MSTKQHQTFMQIAYEEALMGYKEGGAPVGAVMTLDGQFLARGRNRGIQNNDPTSHGETDCIKVAGLRSNYKGVTLYTTLSPCMMCTGTILQFGIKKVIIGDIKNFNENIDLLKEKGVEVVVLPHGDCEILLAKFIQENPKIWNRIIGK